MLKEKRISFDVKMFPETTKKGLESISKALGVNPKRVVKTLILRGQSETFFNCLVGGDGRLDYRKLKRITEEKDIRMATPEEIFNITGYRIGAIPPFTLKNRIKTYLEITLRSRDVLYVGAGVYGIEIVIHPEDLKKATDGEFVDIIKR